MIKNNLENLAPDYEWLVTVDDFILEPNTKYETIRNHGIDRLGAIYMEYRSIEVVAMAITKWAGKILHGMLVANRPLAVRTYVFIPDQMSLSNPGKKYKERFEYLEQTSKTVICAEPLTGRALRLYKEGKDTEAIKLAFEPIEVA